MRITVYALSALLVVTIFTAQQTTQDTKKHGAAEERTNFATNRCLSKGGVGIINTSLYVVSKSSKSDSNELIIKPTEETEERWKGKNVTKAELVFVYKGKVWAPQSLPNGFDLSKAVVVSFESEKIRFFDFQATGGGYYDRIGD